MWVFFYPDTLNYIEKNVIIYNIKINTNHK